MLRVVSLFSGIGGFEEGLNIAKIDHRVVFASEIDSYAKKSYLSNFPTDSLHGDITKIDESDIPDHDLLLAGFPCQSFSIAGKQLGFEDTRGTLFFDVARILAKKKPKYVILENVKNLVNHDHSNTFSVIIHTLSHLGYTLDFSIINSMEAGIPQNRERTYIVGIYGEQRTEYLDDTRNSKINKMKKKLNAEHFSSFNFFNTLTFNNPSLYLDDVLQDDVEPKCYLTSTNVKDYLSKIQIKDFDSHQGKILKILDLPRDIHNDLERQRRVYSVKGISPTLLARSDSPKVLVKENKEFKIRKISPQESFYIQGFSKSFVDNIESAGISDTQMYKQSGNAVSPPVIAGIVTHLFSKDFYKPFSFIDLFAGIGGFRLAFESLGGDCVYSCEIDEAACKTYHDNFGVNPYGDVTTIKSRDIPDFDILCAGFPCQPFSIAGKRLGFEDTRGTLFFDVARILKDKKPKAFILENVKGITNHDGGRTIEVIRASLNEIGYEIKDMVLNSLDYNIPQNRERWYCVGFRQDLGINMGDFKLPKKETLTNTLKNIIAKSANPVYKATSIAMKNIEKFIDLKSIDVIDTTLAYEIRPSRCQFTNGLISPCLTAKMGTGGNNIPVIVKQKRKLTESECLQIMGFPITYKIDHSYQSYKQIGNSIVVPMVQKLAKEMICLLQK